MRESFHSDREPYREREIVRVLSVYVDVSTLSDVLGRVTAFLNGTTLRQIATVNPEFIMTAQHDREFLAILNQSDLNVIDGIGLQCAVRLLHGRRGERIAGVDLAGTIAALAAVQGHSIYLLGGAEGIAERAADRLQSTHPGLTIAGAYAGKPEEAGLIHRINATHPDILFVAFGSPNQERFIFRHRNSLNARLAMGVGGTFDYLAGAVPRAPIALRKAGLEWLFRLMVQPRRLPRIFTATFRFPLAVAAHAMRPPESHGDASAGRSAQPVVAHHQISRE